MIRYEQIKEDEEINAYIKKGNDILGVLGYTDHSKVHATLVANRAAMILNQLGYCKKDVELAKIAGYMHDIGNSINRKNHAEYGGLLADRLLSGYDMSIEDRLTVVSAIANHDESTGRAIDPVSAALIIADKTDVRRNRIRSKADISYDIHDRVNYAVIMNQVSVYADKNLIVLDIDIDENICTMYEYFDIFLQRMLMCRKAAEMLGVSFSLRVNSNKVL